MKQCLVSLNTKKCVWLLSKFSYIEPCITQFFWAPKFHVPKIDIPSLPQQQEGIEKVSLSFKIVESCRRKGNQQILEIFDTIY